MPIGLVIVFVFLTFLVGIGLGYLFRWLTTFGRQGSIELEIKNKLLEAREKAEAILSEARAKAETTLRNAEETKREIDEEVRARTERLDKREAFIEDRHKELEKETAALKARSSELEIEARELRAKSAHLTKALETASSLSKSEARNEFFAHLAREFDEDTETYVRKLEHKAQDKIKARTKEILGAALARLGNSVPSEVFATSLSLPSDEIKGKIIGKEGRNIKSLERRAGVELVIDDTPGVITISSFDPYRRQIARRALESLIQDGRIHPARIEEAVEHAEKEAEEIIKEKGEEAAFASNLYSLDSGLIELVGRMHFRTSYGQNLLSHSMEVARLAGLLAAELGGNVRIAQTAGLLHDIGKVIEGDTTNSHVEAGVRVLKKFNIDEDIITAMKSHHEEYPHESLEAVIVTVADSLSGGRPGARNASTENYIERLRDLEEIANRVSGVDKSYVLQGGRELRVFVYPEEVSDLEARNIAREIAKNIEADLNYPGEIKVHVIRESRIVEYAR